MLPFCLKQEVFSFPELGISFITTFLHLHGKQKLKVISAAHGAGQWLPGRPGKDSLAHPRWHS